MKKALRLLAPLVLGCALLMGAIALPALTNAPVVSATAGQVIFAPWQVQFTYAQTGPTTISEMSTEVSTFATTVMPYWTTYVVGALIFALAAWLIGRFIRAMKA